MVSTKATLETKDTTKDITKCHKETGNNPQETNPIKTDGLKLSFKTNMDNGFMPRFNVNLMIHSKTSMDTSKDRIKEIITTTTITTSTTTNITITTNSYQKETGCNLPETILTKMDSLKLNFRTCMVNGSKLKLQLNLIMLFPTIMDNSYMIKVTVKVTTNTVKVITNTVKVTTNTVKVKTTTTTNKTITTNSYQVEPGNNLLETFHTKMVYSELSFRMLTANGIMLKSNANHTNHLRITMVTSQDSKTIKEIITTTTITTNTTITKTTTTNRFHKVLICNQPETNLIKTDGSKPSLRTLTVNGFMLKFNVNQTKDSETTMETFNLSID